LNLSPQPGPHADLDTVEPTADFYARVDKPLQQSGSSLAGMSRDNWHETTFYVPIKGVEHKPTYTNELPKRTDSTARQRGEYPAQATAVEGTDFDSTGAQAEEAALGPFRAGWDIIWMIPKMVVTPPDRTVSSPRDGYERGPHGSPANNGGLKSAGIGVTLQPLPVQAPPPATTPAGEPLPPTPPPSAVPQQPSPSPAPTPPASPPANPSTQPATPPPSSPGLPTGAIGGSDSHKHREQNKPKEQKP
jgi:hypothetical protein